MVDVLYLGKTAFISSSQWRVVRHFVPYEFQVVSTPSEVVMTRSGDSLSVSCGASALMLGIAALATWIYFREFWPVTVLLGAIVGLLLLATVHYASRRTLIVVRSDDIAVSETSLFLPAVVKSFSSSDVVLFVAKVYSGVNVLGHEPAAWGVLVVFGNQCVVPIAVHWEYSAALKTRDDLPASVRKLSYDGEGILQG